MPKSSSSTPIAAASTHGRRAGPGSPRPPWGRRSRRRRRSSRRRGPRRSSRPSSSKRPDVAGGHQAVDDLLVAAAGVALEEQRVADEDPARLALRQLGRPSSSRILHDGAARRLAGRWPAPRAGPRGWRSRRRRPRWSRRCCRGCRRTGPSTSSARSPGSAEPGRGDDLARGTGRRQSSMSSGRARMRCSITGITTSESQRSSSATARGSPRGRSVRRSTTVEPSSIASARCAKPQVWNSGAAMWVRQPCRSGIRDSSATAASMPASLRGAPFGVPVVPEVRMTMRACRSRRRRGRRRGTPAISGLERVGALGRLASVQARSRCSTSAPASSSVNSSSWITTPRLLALEHVDELRAGEGGVEVEDVGAELGDGDAWRRRSRGGCGTSPRPQSPSPTPRSRSAWARALLRAVQLAVGQRAELVDDAHPVRVHGSPAWRTRRPGRSPSAAASRPSAARVRGRVGPDDAGPAEHLARADAGPGSPDRAGVGDAA